MQAQILVGVDEAVEVAAERLGERQRLRVRLRGWGFVVVFGDHHPAAVFHVPAHSHAALPRRHAA